jgi:hypothetical protein
MLSQLHATGSRSKYRFDWASTYLATMMAIFTVISFGITSSVADFDLALGGGDDSRIRIN